MPRPDDAADALAIAIWAANTERDRARSAPRRGHGPRGDRADRRAASRATSGRSARRSPASARPRARPSAAPPRRVAAHRDRLGRGRGRGGRGRFARHRGRRDRLPGVRRAGDHRRGRAGRPAQAPHLPPRPRGPAGAVRVPRRRGARVLHAAAHRDRRRAEGRARDRRLPADGRPPARDPRPGPGRARGDPGHRQEARRADHLRAQGEGDRGRASRSPGRPSPGAAASEGEIVAALQALGYSLGEAREASRAALADVGVASTLEERVKAALRSLVRD